MSKTKPKTLKKVKKIDSMKKSIIFRWRDIIYSLITQNSNFYFYQIYSISQFSCSFGIL